MKNVSFEENVKCRAEAQCSSPPECDQKSSCVISDELFDVKTGRYTPESMTPGPVYNSKNVILDFFGDMSYCAYDVDNQRFI